MKSFILGNIATIVVMVVLLMFHLIFYYKPYCKALKEKRFSDTSDAISAASSLGVLGTFIGITWSLLNFDASHITDSVPILLDGMKTAFITSVVGMASSLWLKHRVRKLQKENEVLGSTDINDILQKSHLTQIGILNAVSSLANSVGGDGDSTLLTQIKNLRMDNADLLKENKAEIEKMRTEFVMQFSSFAKQMAENNSKAFIEALNETIRNFNDKIQEQFGENFKQLNIAVGKLLDWQENYKDILLQIDNNYKTILENMELSKKALKEMANNSTDIKQAAIDLKEIVHISNEYQVSLKDTLENLVKISIDAKEVIPSVSEMFENVTNDITDLSETSKNSIDNISHNLEVLTEKVIEEIKNSNDQFVNEIGKINSQIDIYSEKLIDQISGVSDLSQKSIDAISQNFESLTEKLVDSLAKRNENTLNIIQKVSEELENSGIKITERVASHLEKVAEESNDIMRKQQKQMLDNFGKTTEMSINGLGKALARISDKYADDYENAIIKINRAVENKKIEF